MGRADARNAVFADNFLAVSTGKPGDKDDQLRLMFLNEPAQHFLGYVKIQGHDMSCYATARLRRWPHEVVIEGDVLPGEFVRRQTTFLHYCNNFVPDIPKDYDTPVRFYKVCSYYTASMHPLTFFLAKVILVALVPAVRIKVNSGFRRHIVALADYQQPFVAAVPIETADPGLHTGKFL